MLQQIQRHSFIAMVARFTPHVNVHHTIWTRSYRSLNHNTLGLLNVRQWFVQCRSWRFEIKHMPIDCATIHICTVIAKTSWKPLGFSIESKGFSQNPKISNPFLFSKTAYLTGRVWFWLWLTGSVVLRDNFQESSLEKCGFAWSTSFQIHITRRIVWVCTS